METYNQTAFPRGLTGDDPMVLKNAHESYDLFVNEQYIGKKELTTPEDNMNHVVDFLHAQGIDDVSTQLKGDHFKVNTNDEERVVKVLKAYLQNN
ncbi:hypothetical protein [Halalkalibacter krulwichiae]|uniref:Uncharacterized protein n=1 Tax=Halalkalibacter krulwichiae TaxID=199441 RepID=A0A1X9MBI1_9BACI|nr:hypothetical protein [Halalkalibacter krulwichiae]ARK29950.1 hypothetical protein BkAM31D_08775 [Halalkalibacter krulwichiae]